MAGAVPAAAATVCALATRAIKDGRVVANTSREIRRIALGVATRRGVPPPDVSSTDAPVSALRRADTVLYSQGTSGLYIEQMLAELGLEAQLKGKAVQTTSADDALGRLPAARDVMASTGWQPSPGRGR